MEFKKYKRTNVAEMRAITDDEARGIRSMDGISISEEDQINGSPKKGDMIARNPKNHKDQWLVAHKYFNDNFEEII